MTSMESGHGMLDHLGSSLSFPTKEDARARAPTLPHRAHLATVLEALLPERETNHPLGCQRSRIPERVVFEKLVQLLVFGCAYERIADETCSATTLRDRRDEWIELGAMDALGELVLEAYDRFVSGWNCRMWRWTAASPRHRRRRGEGRQEPRRQGKAGY
jgi:transposase